MERVIFEQIMNYLSLNNLITDFQHAYRKGHSTTSALTQMTDDWLREIDRKKLVGVVMLDFSAAFDLIDHNLLLKKLECYGFEVSSLSFLRSYLTDRTQTVFFNGCFSEENAVSCGVPQGSCLGPLLYTIYTNDLPLVLRNANIGMYADDSTIYTSALTNGELNLVLREELKAVVDWINCNKLVLNVSKTNCMVIGSYHSISKNPQLHLKIKEVSINQVQETKLLGVVIDDKLTWKTHINKIVNKMGNGISVIRRCKAYLTPKSTRLIMQALILSNLDYCPVVWSNATADIINKLQKVQNRAGRIVLGSDLRTNVLKMHRNLGWLMVGDRLLYSLLIFVRNVSTSKTPHVLHKELQYSSDNHSYTTRHAVSGKFSLPEIKTNYGKRTAMYRAMHAWNSLSTLNK